MKKSDFFSEQNLNLLTQQLKAVGFGLGLQPREVFQLIKPSMVQVYKNTPSSVPLSEMNKRILVLYGAKNEPTGLKTVRVTKERTLDKAVDDYIQRRNAFDVSVGLRPTNYRVGAKPEQKEEIQVQHEPTRNPLDEFFALM